MRKQRIEAKEMCDFGVDLGCPCCAVKPEVLTKVRAKQQSEKHCLKIERLETEKQLLENQLLSVDIAPLTDFSFGPEGEKSWVELQEEILMKNRHNSMTTPLKTANHFLRELLYKGQYIHKAEFYKWLKDMGYIQKDPKKSRYLATQKAVVLGVLSNNRHTNGFGIRITYRGQRFFAQMLEDQAHLAKIKSLRKKEQHELPN